MRKPTHIFLAFVLSASSAPLWAQTLPAAAPASQPAFHPAQGQRVEVYWVRQWWSATVREVRGEQVLIRNDQRARYEEWVPLSSLRKFTKAWKYPMPATADEIAAQTDLETARREAERSRGGSAGHRLGPTGRHGPDDFADADVSPIDTASMKRLTGNPKLPLAGIAPDTEPAPKAVSARPMPLDGSPQPDASPFDPHPAGVFAAPAAGQVFALSEVPGFRPIKLVQRFDAGTGDASPAAMLESSMEVNAISSDGTRLVGTNRMRKGHFAEPNAIEVWSLAEKAGPKLLVAFTPTADEHEGHFVELARFVDTDHVLTLTLGKLTCWEVPAAKAVYTRDLGQRAVIATSATGKYVAAADGQSIRLFDAATGALRGHLPAADPAIQPSLLAFSPDGTRLLAAEGQRTVVYDLTKPAVVADIAMPRPLSGGVFLSPGYLLVDGRYVVDVAKGLVLWDYVHGDGPSRVSGGRVWYVSQPKSPYTPSLYSAVVPTDEALHAAVPPPEELYAVKPGTAVALDLNTGLPAEAHEKCVEALRAAVEKAGLVVSPDAPTRLVATSAAGESREIAYRMFGHPGQTKVSVTTYTYTLSVQQGGKTLWQVQDVVGPSAFLSLKRDQSIEEALQEGRERSAANFFSSARVPRYLPKATDHPGQGQTVLPGAEASDAVVQPGKKDAPPKRLPPRRPGTPSGGKTTTA